MDVKIDESYVSQPPEPGRPLIFCSYAVIGVCVSFAGMGLGGLLGRLWDPCAFIGFLVLGLPALGMAVLQYRGTFRRHKQSAELNGGLAGGVSVLFVLTPAVGFVEGLAFGHDVFGMLSLFLVMLALGIGWGFVATMNFRWAKRLQVPSKLPASWKTWRFSLWELFGLVTAFALGIGMAVNAARLERPEVGIHVEAKDCPYRTPAGAIKISYRQSVRGTYYLEFDISEADFRQWVIEEFKSHPKYKGVYMGLQPITRGSYVYPVEFKGTFPPPEITNGLECHWTFEDEGMHAVYDRSVGRAYYHEHWH